MTFREFSDKEEAQAYAAEIGYTGDEQGIIPLYGPVFKDPTVDLGDGMVVSGRTVYLPYAYRVYEPIEEGRKLMRGQSAG